MRGCASRPASRGPAHLPPAPAEFRHRGTARRSTAALPPRRACSRAKRASSTYEARAVKVDDRAGGRGRRFGGQPADGFGNLVGAGDPAERNVVDDGGAAAASEIFLG